MMNLRQEDVEVAGLTFTTRQFAAYRGLEVFAQLLKLLGPAAGLAQAAAESDDGAIDMQALGPALESALSKLEPRDAAAFALVILAGTSTVLPDAKGVGKVVVIDDRNKFDRVFSGRGLKTIFRVIGHAVKVNFAADPTDGDASAPTLSTTDTAED